MYQWSCPPVCGAAGGRMELSGCFLRPGVHWCYHLFAFKMAELYLSFLYEFEYSAYLKSVGSYDVCPFVSGLFHLTWHLQGSPCCSKSPILVSFQDWAVSHCKHLPVFKNLFISLVDIQAFPHFCFSSYFPLGYQDRLRSCSPQCVVIPSCPSLSHWESLLDVSCGFWHALVIF